jgi:DNA polymerase III gamma/tau subunit
MENFIVSARKYRPLDFKSVVGQDSITATLKNSVKNKQLAHAYLFCGPRGVGKTTCARIFAKRSTAKIQQVIMKHAMNVNHAFHSMNNVHIISMSLMQPRIIQ